MRNSKFKVYLGPYKQLKVSNYFRKKHHQRYLTEYQIRLCEIYVDCSGSTRHKMRSNLALKHYKWFVVESTKGPEVFIIFSQVEKTKTNFKLLWRSCVAIVKQLKQRFHNQGSVRALTSVPTRIRIYKTCRLVLKSLFTFAILLHP